MKKVNKVEQDLSFYSAFSYQAYQSFSNLCSVSHGHYSPPCHSLLTTGIRGESFRPSITRNVAGHHCKLSLRSSSGILLTSKLQSMTKVYPTKLVSCGTQSCSPSSYSGWSISRWGRIGSYRVSVLKLVIVAGGDSKFVATQVSHGLCYQPTDLLGKFARSMSTHVLLQGNCKA